MDAFGLTNLATFTVTVRDTTPPSITAPPTLLTNTVPGQCYATGVNLGTPLVSDNSGAASFTNDAPAQFPKGFTVVTWTARDASGNTNTAAQFVSVRDLEPPVITNCAASRILALGVNCSLALPDLTAEVRTTDNCGGPVTIIQNPPPGVALNFGTNIVLLFARHRPSNPSICQAQVVLPANPPIAVPDRLTTSINLGLTVAASDLLTNDTHPDGRQILGITNVAAHSSGGGRISFD